MTVTFFKYTGSSFCKMPLKLGLSDMFSWLDWGYVVWPEHPRSDDVPSSVHHLRVYVTSIDRVPVIWNVLTWLRWWLPGFSSTGIFCGKVLGDNAKVLVFVIFWWGHVLKRPQSSIFFIISSTRQTLNLPNFCSDLVTDLWQFAGRLWAADPVVMAWTALLPQFIFPITVRLHFE